MRISDWSSDVCSSDLRGLQLGGGHRRDIVRPDRRPDDPRRIGRRLTPLDRIDITHAVDHAPDRGVFAVKFQHRLKHDEELAVRAVLTRSEEHTSELQSLMRISYAVFCLKKKKKNTTH